MDKLVIVPQKDIDAIEKARLNLYEQVDSDELLEENLHGVTESMWKLTHSKYKEYKKYLDEKIAVVSQEDTDIIEKFSQKLFELVDDNMLILSTENLTEIIKEFKEEYKK